MRPVHHIYKRHASPPANTVVFAALLFLALIFLIITIALKGDVLTLSTLVFHGLYFFFTIDQRRVEKKRAIPVFASLPTYRIVRALILLLIAYVALFLHTALGDPWVLFDISLWWTLWQSR